MDLSEYANIVCPPWGGSGILVVGILTTTLSKRSKVQTYIAVLPPSGSHTQNMATKLEKLAAK